MSEELNPLTGIEVELRQRAEGLTSEEGSVSGFPV
jgi:hypothetical protein